MTPTSSQAPSQDVRPATLDDYAALVTLLRSTRLFGFLTRAAVLGSIEREELLVALAPTHYTVTGLLRFHARRDGISTIYDLYVAPHYRRQGYATALFRAVNPPKRLKCPNQPPFAAAHAFYKRHNPTRATPVQNMTIYEWLPQT